jgi:hypothetical protein
MSGPTDHGRRREAGVAGQVLESVYQHRLLSSTQVHALHMPDSSLRSTQRVLAALRREKVIATLRPPAGPLLCYLTERGATAVETVSTRAEARRKLLRPEQANGPLQQHTLAVNDAGIAFVQAARRRGHECGPHSWRHEIAHSIGPPPGRRRPEHVIADALLTYQLTEPDRPTSIYYRFLELDRATIAVETLAAKLARYTRLYHHATTTDSPATERAPDWTHYYPVFPTVLVALAHQPRSRLERRRQTVLALCHDDPDLKRSPEVEVSICLLADLTEHGPFAPIFLAADDPQTPVDWLGQSSQCVDGRRRP